MVEFRWIKMFLNLILVLQCTAVTEQLPLSFTVRAGDEVTLPCENVRNDQRKCHSISWSFNRLPGRAAADVVKQGQIVKNSKAESDRLTVAENCSLVIKNVTEEDVGRYHCIQPNRSDTVDLSVVTMTEQKNNKNVMLNCSVSSTYGGCGHTVKWLFQGRDVGEDNKDLKTSQFNCWTSVTFMTSHYIYTSEDYYKIFKCNVTDGHTRKVITFSLQSPGEKTVGVNKTAPRSNNSTTKPLDWWWLYIIVPVGLAALFITVVALIQRRRNKGNKSHEEENVGLSLNPPATPSAPETSQDTADPEGGVSYASISFTKKTNSRAQVRGGDDAVTYSTVKAPSSSAGSSANPSDLYATVNTPNNSTV
ncbi:uncharacterized protein LOC116056177 isoform X2 [Sander lucioperca]|uniref:uncharacterized protein LOC116056177 isoform X2 n=1 Tax=Sander lucioperca TaxID=283035 RepID=UPI001653CF9F|nr:uncharacterized protein LOC116056177 isoform X2 [Sander lucioperca]